MPYLANYRNDIFVSYAHGPMGSGHGTGAEDKLGQWTRQLKADLEQEILVSLGTKDPSRQCTIWIDPELRGNQPLTDTLREEIDGSALLLVVMSRFYLESTWCLDEIEWFRRSCLRRGETTKGRIFVVRAFATEEALWPPGLRDSSRHPLPGYRFHPDGDGGYEKPFGWASAATDVDYQKAISQLAADISRQLSIADMPTRDRIEEAATQAPPSAVFLACMHDTVDEERAEIRERLAAAGITVLPPEDEDPVDEASLRAAFENHLRRADAIVLIANEYRGAWPKEQPGGFISLQIQKAKESQKRCDLWLRVEDLARVRKPEYRQYLETLSREAEQTGITIRHDDLPGFVGYIVDKLKSLNDPKGVQTLDLGDAVICANRPEDESVGKDFLESIKATLSELRQESFTFDFADPKEERIKLTNLEKHIRNASTVLVLCFDQDWEWARPFLRLLNGLSHIRGEGKVRLLITGPRDRNEAHYDARALGFPTVDSTDKDAQELKELLRQAIQSAAPKTPPPSTEKQRG